MICSPLLAKQYFPRQRQLWRKPRSFNQSNPVKWKMKQLINGKEAKAEATKFQKR